MRCSVSVLIATRPSGSNRRSVIDSLSVCVSMLSSTTAFPKPTRAANNRSILRLSSAARSAPERCASASSPVRINPPSVSMTETSSGVIPRTAEATRYFKALAWLGDSEPLPDVTVTDAVGWLSWRNGCESAFEMWTRAALIYGLAVMLRASSPSFARLCQNPTCHPAAHTRQNLRRAAPQMPGSSAGNRVGRFLQKWHPRARHR